MKAMLLIPLTMTGFLVLQGCTKEEPAAVLPDPVAMTEEAVGYYCNMNILEHTGPKAQIHLKGIEMPVWFSQVRDGVAFLRSPEETFEVVAVYVNDMGKAKQWDFPGDDTWINAENAWFVIGSVKSGGMGAPEVIPFASGDDAKAFIAESGGTAVRLADIPDDYVLGPVDLQAAPATLPTGAVQ